MVSLCKEPRVFQRSDGCLCRDTWTLQGVPREVCFLVYGEMSVLFGGWMKYT